MKRRAHAPIGLVSWRSLRSLSPENAAGRHFATGPSTRKELFRPPQAQTRVDKPKAHRLVDGFYLPYSAPPCMGLQYLVQAAPRLGRPVKRHGKIGC